MRRKQAARLIDDLRQLSATHTAHGIKDEGARGLRAILVSYGLAPLCPCDGEAHSNPHVDNCLRCSPRWGFVGPFEVVS